MKKILKFLPMIPVFLITMALTVSYIKATPNPYPESTPDSEVPIYDEVTLNHTHNYNGKEFLPVVGSAIIDIDGDGTSEVFIGGGQNQDDQIYRYTNGAFASVQSVTFSKDNNDSTYGASVVDINKDGKDDLLIARESGGYLYINQGASFSAKKLDLLLNQKSRAISFAPADINLDGHLDLYVSSYLTRKSMEGQNIFNKEGYGGTSAMLLNNGDNTFKDITKSSGIHTVHNTFMGIFVDMDDDNDLDLVVAQDTGKVKTWRNNGDTTFTDIKNPFSNFYGYPMGIGAGDYNLDGKIDFYFSNVGPTAPKFMAKGDLRDDQIFYTDLMLMENQGNMNFVDSSKKTKLADYEFSWGITMADLNLDGLQDMIISENYVDLPFQKIFKLPGRMLLQRQDHTFASVEKQAGVVNKKYEIAPLLADFNNDGYLDQIRVNLSGRSKAFISRGGQNKVLKVKIASTAEFLGSKVEVEMTDGTRLYDWHISGEGLCSDQEHTLIFGLGQSRKASKVTITLADGRRLSKSALGQNMVSWNHNES